MVDELVCVCWFGGMIGVISWMCEGFFGWMLVIIRLYWFSVLVDLLLLVLWGCEVYVIGLLGDGVIGFKMVCGLLEVKWFDIV